MGNAIDQTGVLSREQIDKLIADDPPLISGLVDREEQLQPNGFDLTLATVARFVGAGALTRDNRERRLPETEELEFGLYDQIQLSPGPYLVRFNETISLPTNVMAYARPRSSLLRSGVALHTAVWDAGYSGQGVALMIVYNPEGFLLQRDARIVNWSFIHLAPRLNQVIRAAIKANEPGHLSSIHQISRMS